MRRIDLHCHSTASDGTDAPAEVARLAKEAGLAAFALTDHDTLAGVAEARAAAEAHGVELVAGVELSARHPGSEMHVLGYFLADDHPGVLASLAALRRGRRERIERTVAVLAALGVEISLDDVLAEVGDGSPGRPHVARALVRRGHVATLQEAFDRYLAQGRPAHVPRREMTPGECVGLILKGGGVAVLAHPVTVAEEELPAAVASLARFGLQGIEVHHPKHDAAFREELLRLAERHDLVPTGGSDYHGAGKPDVRLGSGRDGNVAVGYEVLEALRERRA